MGHRPSLIGLLLWLFVGCATYGPHHLDSKATPNVRNSGQIVHSFYLIGDAGNAPMGDVPSGLVAFGHAMEQAPESATALFLGDNIYPKGMPNKDSPERELAEYRLQVQLDVAQKFSGRSIFIPGNHDWYSGLSGLRDQEKMVDDALGKNSFLPERGCPIDKVDISDDIVLLVLDSKWYLNKWDKFPTINDHCEIRTRDAFWDEVESEIKKARGKTTLIAVHHPIFSNGPHGGQYSAKQHLTPIPVVGTLKNILRKTSGAVPADLQNQRYTEFRKTLEALARENSRTLLLSGHEHSMQLLEKDGLVQLISGAGSKQAPARLAGDALFTYGGNGYARLDLYKDGSGAVSFFGTGDAPLLYEKQVLPAWQKNTVQYPKTFPDSVSASIYSLEETQKGKLHKGLFGDRYRAVYSTPVKAPTVLLDTLFGGVVPVRKGGGTQSKSLRLQAGDGRQYVMRSLRKSATQFIQAALYKDRFVYDAFEDTYTQDLLLDFFAGSHPYAPFVTGTLSDPVSVYHTNPKLYYVPKQKALGPFNKDFGDALYMIEEHPSEGHGNVASFGYSDELISSLDLLEQLRLDEKYQVDQAAFVRARLLDMLLGDWDRHADQWRWATFEEKGRVLYRPVPRDRDQVFSKIGDGFGLDIVTRALPGVRFMKPYGKDITAPRWVNPSPYSFPFDMALLPDVEEAVWLEQAEILREGITDEVIEKAFTFFPPEINRQELMEIQQVLRGRRQDLDKIAKAYHRFLSKQVVVTGTDKDDWFVVERLPDGKTKLEVYRNKKGKPEDMFHQRLFSKEITQEIWLYGLDDDDIFEVKGEGDHMIKVRIVGGQNNDVYRIGNPKNVVVYDYKTKPNTFEGARVGKKLTDDYETNVYHFKKPKFNENLLLPILGYNPDDGVKLGAQNTYTVYGFERNPFTSKHQLGAAFYFATSGLELGYQGEFARVIGAWNLQVTTRYTTPNYSVNFFGYGNGTENPNWEDDDTYDMDYNRVRISALKVAPKLVWYGEQGGSLALGANFLSMDVERTHDRYINTFYVANGEQSKKDFWGATLSYTFENKDDVVFPTLGMQFSFNSGYTQNITDGSTFGFIDPSLALQYPLSASGNWVLATQVGSRWNLGNGYEFYQAASIGGDNGLRAYRNQRFSGRSSFYQSTDIRFLAADFHTALVPMQLGFYSGFDYGRVWEREDDASQLHNAVGGGVFLNGAHLAVGNLAVFYGAEGWRLSFGMGFQF